jgi:PAS domain S-box-containing protein
MSIKTELNEFFFKSLLNSLPYTFFWKNSDSVYLGCNLNFARIAGLRDPADVVGLTDFELAWGEGEAEYFREVDKQILTGQLVYFNNEEELVRPDGEVVTMLVSKIPVEDNNGCNIGLLGVSTDITHIKKAERDLKEAKDMAELANAKKAEFLTNMSHDFRTPLSAILGASDILSRHKHYLHQKEMFSIISRAGNSLLTLVDEILDFSKLEAGKIEPNIATFDLLECIEDIVNFLSQQATNKGLKLIISYSARAPRYICSDPAAVRRIIVNLLNNAIKFTNEGHIIVSVNLSELEGQSAAEISVEDTGIGIPFDKLHFIFDRFTRVHPSYHGRYQGSGLGLNIVKQLADYLGARIDVNSNLDQGSKFSITLPYEISVKLENQLIPEKLLSLLPVLIIDDASPNGQSLQNYLGNHCNLTTSANWREAYNAQQYSIILVDDEIHHSTFTEVAYQLRASNHAESPMLILLTRARSFSEYSAVKAAGYFKFLIKPVVLNELLDNLYHAWQEWSNTVELPARVTDKGSINVLLVEDDKFAQRISSHLLTELNCKVTIATCGQEAIDKFNLEFNLVFLDIGLGDMNGLDVALALRAINPKIPIVVLTAHASQEERKLATQYGLEWFLIKPIVLEDIRTVINSLHLAQDAS